MSFIDIVTKIFVFSLSTVENTLLQLDALSTNVARIVLSAIAVTFSAFSIQKSSSQKRSGADRRTSQSKRKDHKRQVRWAARNQATQERLEPKYISLPRQRRNTAIPPKTISSVQCISWTQHSDSCGTRTLYRTYSSSGRSPCCVRQPHYIQHTGASIGFALLANIFSSPGLRCISRAALYTTPVTVCLRGHCEESLLDVLEGCWSCRFHTIRQK